MVFAIGAGDQVIAVDSFSNHPASAPVTDLTGFAPNVEAIVSLDADLVLIDGDYDGSSVGSMTELGIPVLVLPAAEGFEEVYSQIGVLGVATGRVEDANRLVSELRSEIDELVSSSPVLEEPLTFYHELDDTYYSVTSETFIGQVYTLMGLVNIADAVGEGSFGYPQLSEEYILEQDPDLIFLADTICCGVDASSLADRPGWNSLTAVERGAVIELDDDVASRWGPRIIELIRTVGAAIATQVAAGT
jgi:iron complex transport system substrate-binding protein